MFNVFFPVVLQDYIVYLLDGKASVNGTTTCYVLNVIKLMMRQKCERSFLIEWFKVYRITNCFDGKDLNSK